jgi:serine phosphatase RsbU (regulator of sigma subunit)
MESNLFRLQWQTKFSIPFYNEARRTSYRAKMLFEEAASGSPKQIIARLLEEEKAWANGRPQDDDVTFVVMKVK